MVELFPGYADCYGFMRQNDRGRWFCPRCDPDAAITFPLRAHRKCCPAGDCGHTPPEPDELEKSIAFRIEAGLATLDEAEVWRRFDTCQACEHLDGEPGDEGCGRMDCSECRRTLYLRLAITTDERPCPEGRFGVSEPE